MPHNAEVLEDNVLNTPVWEAYKDGVVMGMRMYLPHIHKTLRMCHMGSDVNTWSPLVALVRYV